jgi:hypothetical protein
VIVARASFHYELAQTFRLTLGLTLCGFIVFDDPSITLAVWNGDERYEGELANHLFPVVSSSARFKYLAACLQ